MPGRTATLLQPGRWRDQLRHSARATLALYLIDLHAAPYLEPQRATRLLDPMARKRLSNMRQPRRRARYLQCQAVLRWALASHACIAPEELQIVTGNHGKPALCGAGAHWHFNLSHSHRYALLGVACRRRIGVDIERIRDDLSMLQIAAQYFSAREYAHLQQLQSAALPTAFFTCWTAREAFVKGRGEGLALLQQCEISLSRDGRAQLAATTFCRSEVTRWELWTPACVPGYVAAVSLSRE